MIPPPAQEAGLTAGIGSERRGTPGRGLHGWALVAFLGAVATVSPMSIDMALPALPQIEREFAAGVGRGSLTLSWFLAGFAAMPLLAGPLSDRYGRRTILLCGLAVFAASAAGCAAATSFAALVALRIVQGAAAGACTLVPVAMVRDMFDGDAARRRLSEITAMLGLAPILAPLLGAGLVSAWNWQAIFGTQAAVAAVLLVIATPLLRESLPPARRRPAGFAPMLAACRTALARPGFARMTAVNGAGFACVFSFIAGSPAVLQGRFHLSTAMFAVSFALVAGCFVLGSLANARLSQGRLPAHVTLAIAVWVMVAASASSWGLAISGLLGPATLLPLCALVMACFGTIGPNATHLAMAGVADVSGSASGIMRTGQIGMGAIAATIAGLPGIGQPLLCTGAMLGFAVLAATLLLAMNPRLRTSPSFSKPAGGFDN